MKIFILQFKKISRLIKCKYKICSAGNQSSVRIHYFCFLKGDVESLFLSIIKIRIISCEIIGVKQEHE